MTICTKGRECLFGNIIEGRTRLNCAGEMIGRWWREIRQKFQNIQPDEFVVMPNHFHGIVVVGADLRVCPDPVHPDLSSRHQGTNNPGAHAGAPLHRVIQWFKTMTTNEYIRGVKNGLWPACPGVLWQQNYFDRIVRNDDELERIREYIRQNPERWDQDPENVSGWFIRSMI